MNKHNKQQPVLLYSILTFIFILSISGCKSSKTYNEDETYVENYVHFEKDTKQHLNGMVIRKFNEGEVQSEWPYKNGLVDGKTKNYFKSGKIQAKGNYKNGQKNGKQIIYHNNGKEYETSNYEDGKLNGHYIIYLTSGSKEKEAQYVNGTRKSSTTYSYFENGTLRRENHEVDDHLVSKKRYYENGNLKTFLIINHPEREQILRDYSFQGVLSRELKAIDNKLSVKKQYSLEGQLKSETYCTDSEFIIRKTYSDDGKLISEDNIIPKQSIYTQHGYSCNKNINYINL